MIPANYTLLGACKKEKADLLTLESELITSTKCSLIFIEKGGLCCRSGHTFFARSPLINGTSVNEALKEALIEHRKNWEPLSNFCFEERWDALQPSDIKEVQIMWTRGSTT